MYISDPKVSKVSLFPCVQTVSGYMYTARPSHVHVWYVVNDEFTILLCKFFCFRKRKEKGKGEGKGRWMSSALAPERG